jgi:hypothetical protein
MDELFCAPGEPDSQYSCCGEQIIDGDGYRVCRGCHERICERCSTKGFCPPCHEKEIE